MTLQEQIKATRQNEKATGKGYLVYRVFEGGNLIYVGLGGKGKRPGSGRLAEHNSTSSFSSFRHQYYINQWKNGSSYDEATALWDQLQWDAIHCESVATMERMEDSIIKATNPPYNRS